MQLTSAVECTHRSLLEELWLRVYRSPHQEQQLLNIAEKEGSLKILQSRVKAFKNLKFSVAANANRCTNINTLRLFVKYISFLGAYFSAVRAIGTSA